MDRLPYFLNAVFILPFGLTPVLLLLGEPASDIPFVLMGATCLSIFISAGLLWWSGLPLNATVGEYRERVNFLRNEVKRVPLDDNVPSA